MVLLASAICSKDGNAMLSRQFVEMSKARIEGLLASFPKLLGTGKQHTFVETESVRYVYQPLDNLYVLLITTKASNILEDLETLRMFARVIPEYSKGTDEFDIYTNAFDIISAFDEIVALGYRENVNLAQVRTFTEMDSHEERVYRALRETQEKDAKENMKRKAKELAQKRKEEAKYGRSYQSKYNTTSFGSYASSSSQGRNEIEVTSNYATESSIPSSTDYIGRKGGVSTTGGAPTRALKLGGKSRGVDSFVDQLKAEGERVATSTDQKPGETMASGNVGVASRDNVSNVITESVHCRIEEKIHCLIKRDGALVNMDINGSLHIRVGKENLTGCKLRLKTHAATTKGAQFTTHPNMDKTEWQKANVLQVKSGGRAYPLNQDVGVLRWRFQAADESSLPITINCWPNVNGTACEVNIEYELTDKSLEFENVCIKIPLPGGYNPVINECEGTYEYGARYSYILWKIPLMDAKNSMGTLDFVVNGGTADDFFPVEVDFAARKSFFDITVADALLEDGCSVTPFSFEALLFPEKYEIE